MAKIVICRCEDVTLDDIVRAIDEGYTEMETLKRYLGIGTGMCQGKVCISHLASLIKPPGKAAEIRPVRSRPPMDPTPLGLFAEGEQ